MLSPAQRKPFAVGVNPKPGSGEMEIDDALQCRDKTAPGSAEESRSFHAGSVAVVQVLPYRLDEPERGIHGVVFRRLSLVWKAIRQHSAVDVPKELQQYFFGCVGLVGGQEEAGQSDHGVAAPIAKPVVSSDYRFERRSGDDEMLGRGFQLLDQSHDAERVRIDGVRLWRRVTSEAIFRRSLSWNAVPSRQSGQTCSVEFSETLEGQRIEQVFPMIQALRSLFGKFKIVVPIASCHHLIRIVRHG